MIANKYEVIDAHCHIYPEKIAMAAVSHTDSFYGIHSAYNGTVETLLKQGGQAGVDRFIVQSVATTTHQVPDINRFIAAAVKVNEGKLIGLGTLHPDSTEPEKDVEQVVELGLKGVKLHPDIQGFGIDDSRCVRLYELCQNAGLPVLMHTGDSRYDYSNPNRLLPVLRQFPNLIVIGAHLGGWSIWEEAAGLLAGSQNLYVDCSSTIAHIGAEKAKQIIMTYGMDRVLFGTDFPMWGAQPEIDALLEMGFTDDEYRKLFSENAKRVYRIE